MISLLYWNCINNTIGDSNGTWVGINSGLSAYQCSTAIGFWTYRIGQSWYRFFCVFYSYVVLGTLKKGKVSTLLSLVFSSCSPAWIFWNLKDPVQLVLGFSNFEKSSFMISHFKKTKKNIVALCKQKSHHRGISNFQPPSTYWPRKSKIKYCAKLL